VRKTARLLLKSRWLSASLITFVAVLFIAVLPLPYLFLPKLPSLLCSGIISLFAARPVLMGYMRWCAGLELDNKPKVSELFYFFSTPKRYFKSVLVGAVVFLRVFLTATLSMLPTAVCFSLAAWLKAQPYNEITDIFIRNLLMLGIGGAVLFLVLFVLIALKNSATPYFMAINDKMRISEAVRSSRYLVNQKGGYIFGTLALLLPLCALILPAFIIIPYYVTFFAQIVKRFPEI